MNNEELISVIVPIYNGEKYLNRCVDSICNQSYKNLEIILINDGSTDKSIDICKEYEKLDNRIRIIDKKNTGVSNTRNIGIKESTGNYIMFVDCDDYIYQDSCNILMRNLYEFSADISIGNLFKSKEMINSNTSKDIEIMNFEEDKKLLYLSIYNNPFKDIEFIEGSVGKIYRKNLIISNKIEFSSDLKYGEDSLFNLECYSNAKKIILTKEIVYDYIKNSDSASSGKLFDLYEEIKKMLIKHKEKLFELKMFELLETDYYIFGLRQMYKIIMKCGFNKELFTLFIKDNFYKELLNNVPYRKLSFKQKIKYILIRLRILTYFSLNK